MRYEEGIKTIEKLIAAMEDRIETHIMYDRDNREGRELLLAQLRGAELALEAMTGKLKLY